MKGKRGEKQIVGFKGSRLPAPPPPPLRPPPPPAPPARDTPPGASRGVYPPASLSQVIPMVSRSKRQPWEGP